MQVNRVVMRWHDVNSYLQCYFKALWWSQLSFLPVWKGKGSTMRWSLFWLKHYRLSNLVDVFYTYYKKFYSILSYLFILAAPYSMWDLPQSGIEPASPAVEARSLNHWTTREGPVSYFRFHISVISYGPYPYLAPPQYLIHIWDHSSF